jgi:hypothetical protein
LSFSVEPWVDVGSDRNDLKERGTKKGHGGNIVKCHHGVVASKELTQLDQGSMRVDVVSSRAELLHEMGQ